MIRTPRPDVNFLTPETLSRRFGLSPHETGTVPARSEIRTQFRRGHHVIDIRAFVAARLASYPSKGGGR